MSFFYSLHIKIKVSSYSIYITTVVFYLVIKLENLKEIGNISGVTEFPELEEN